jgi:hypothetical protein
MGHLGTVRCLVCKEEENRANILVECKEAHREKSLLKNKWLYKNKETDYKKLTRFSKIRVLENLRKILYENKCKEENPREETV